jgi:hypothetical protein
MISRWIRAAALPAALALGPATTLAFDTVDTLRWPSAGVFAPTYIRDPLLPWSIFAYGGTMYDTNVLRRPDQTADWISRIGVGGRYTARVYGRQSIALDGYGEFRTYDELSEFNHFAYGLRGQWLWELGNQLAGTAAVSRTQRLGDLAETRTKAIIVSDRFDLAGAYRFHPDWRLTGGIGGSRVENDSRAVETTRTLGTRGGIGYVSPLGNSVGIELRHAQGEEPIDDRVGIGSFPGNEYEENEAAFTLTYALGETLRLRGRLGYTERTYTEFPASNFSGTTGRGHVDWRVGAKTLLTFEAYRIPDSVIDVDALYVDVRGVGMGIHWAPTYKLVLSARGLSERRIHRGDVLAASTGLPPRDETTRVIRFGLGWEPERRWQLSTGVDFGTRTSNLLARDYDYTAFMANLRWTY